MILYDSTNNTTNPNGLIQKAWRAYKGNTNWPTSGQAKYLQMVMTANDLKDQWAKDSHNHWDSLFVTRTYGPIVAGTQAYPLDHDVFYLADAVYVNRTDGNIDRFSVVHPETRYQYWAPTGTFDFMTLASDNGDPVVYLTKTSANGGEALVLNFQDSPIATQLPGDIGGTISVDCYALPPDMVNATDIVPVNDPQWLVYALAAEMARNDPAKQDQYPILQGMANDIYKKMVKDNQGNSYQQPNSPAYNLRNPGVTWIQT